MMANAADAEAPLVGLTLSGKYTLEEVVGVGAMGAVYRAHHLSLDKAVAVKVLHPSLSQHPTFVERFKREAFSASRLDHPNSLRVLDFGEEKERGLVYLVLDYVEGEDLLAVMEREWPLPDERVVNVLSQALAALAVAHDLGIVHRDLKPENILLLPGTDDEGAHIDLVKVCDFGIAKLALRSVEEGRPFASHLTTEGLIIGTPDYMSPEQARGVDVDGRSDIYSMGCVLYHLLAGRTPFTSESPLAIAIQHVSDPPVPPSHLRPTHPGLEAVCLKALSKRPEDRYASARDMRRALRQALGESTSILPSIVPAPVISHAPPDAVTAASTVRTPDPLLTLPRFSSSPAPTEVTAEHPPRDGAAPKRPWKRGAALALLVVAVGGTVLVLGSFRPLPAPASTTMLEVPPPALVPALTAAVPAPPPLAAAAELVVSSVAPDPVAGDVAAPSTPPPAPSGASAPAATPSGIAGARSPAALPAPVVRAPARPPPRRSDELAAAPSIQTASTAKTAAEKARAALLPLSSLPGTATTLVPSDAANAPTITLERVAPVPLAPTPSPPVAPPAAPAMYDVSAAYVAVGSISTTSGISVASVRSAVAHLALTSCYRQALRAQPIPSSMQATLTLAIDIAGRVTGASLSRDGNLPGLRSCIEGEARGASVRDVDTGEGSATVTLTFAAP